MPSRAGRSACAKERSVWEAQNAVKTGAHAQKRIKDTEKAKGAAKERKAAAKSAATGKKNYSKGHTKKKENNDNKRTKRIAKAW